MSEITLFIAVTVFIFTFYHVVLLPKLKKLKHDLFVYFGFEVEKKTNYIDPNLFSFMKKRNLSPLKEIPDRINYDSNQVSIGYEQANILKNSNSLFTPSPNKRNKNSCIGNPAGSNYYKPNHSEFLHGNNSLEYNSLPVVMKEDKYGNEEKSSLYNKLSLRSGSMEFMRNSALKQNFTEYDNSFSFNRRPKSNDIAKIVVEPVNNYTTGYHNIGMRNNQNNYSNNIRPYSLDNKYSTTHHQTNLSFHSFVNSNTKNDKFNFTKDQAKASIGSISENTNKPLTYKSKYAVDVSDFKTKPLGSNCKFNTNPQNQYNQYDSMQNNFSNKKDGHNISFNESIYETARKRPESDYSQTRKFFNFH